MKPIPAATRAVEHAAEDVKQHLAEAVGGPARLQIIIVLASVLALDAADKATISAVAGSLESVFHIGNASIGLLISVVSFIGAIFTLPFGVLVDRVRRNKILIWAVAVWSVAMAVSGISTSFTFLLITRLALGGVTAAAFPAVASLTGDFFPARDRSRTYGLILAGELIGTGIGFFIAGELSSWWSWRVPFFVIAALGAVVVWEITRFLPEPARGGQSWITEGQEEIQTTADTSDDAKSRSGGTEQSRNTAKVQETVLNEGVQPREELVLDKDPADQTLWWALRYELRVPTYLLLIISSSLGYFFFAGIRSFGMIFMTGHFDVSRSTMSGLSIVIGLGALGGVVVGGNFSEWLLQRKWMTARIIVPGTTLFLSALFFAPGIWTTVLAAGIPLITAGAFMLAAANPPIDAARLDIMHPRLWGRAESGRMALRAVLEGGAPLLFGIVSDWFGGGAPGLERTFLIMLIPLLIASSLAIPAHRTYPRDVATAAASVKRTAAEVRTDSAR